MEGGKKKMNSETLLFHFEREPAIGRLSDERQKAAFKAMIAEILLKVSFPSNYIFHFISAFRQTASEALERKRERNTNKFSFKSDFERRKKEC